MTDRDADVVRCFEDMAPGERANAAHAASQYLLAHDFASLQEASDDRGLAVQELWDEIMIVARLPACSVPLFAFVD